MYVGGEKLVRLQREQMCGVTEFLNPQEQGWDDAGRGESMVDREALIIMSYG